MSNILIIGGGISGERFCASLIFFSDNQISLSSQNSNGKTIKLARKYNFPFILYSNLERIVNEFDLIILSTPLGTKSKIFENLVVQWGYRNKFILEKPLAISDYDLIKIVTISKKYDISFIVAYMRRYIKDISYDKQEDLYIKYPSIKGDKYVLHNLSHALDLCMHICECDEFIIKKMIKKTDIFIIKGICDNVNVNITVHQTDDSSDCVLINDSKMDWCQLESYSEMVQLVLNEYSCNYIKRDMEIARILRECSVYYKDDLYEKK